LQFSETVKDYAERSSYFGKYLIIRGENVEIQGFSGVITPMSIDSYYENKLKELSQELNTKIRELQNINFATSHRIRSPLARILGLIEILKMENKYDPYMAMLEECSRELDEEIRQFSRRLEKEKSPDK
jgi:signal transduction histidine kinase